MDWQPISTIPRDGTWVRLKGQWTAPDGELVQWALNDFTGCNAGGRRPIPILPGFWRTPEGWMWVHDPNTLEGWRLYHGDADAGWREIPDA